MTSMIVLRECTDWRREFMKHGIPFIHNGNHRFFAHETDDIDAPLIVYDPGAELIFSWRGGSLLEVYCEGPNGPMKPLSCFQVVGKTVVPGELSPEGGGWPTAEEIMEAIKTFRPDGDR